MKCLFCGEDVPKRVRMRRYCNARHRRWFLDGKTAKTLLCTECGAVYIAPSHVTVCSAECRERRRVRYPRVHPPICVICGNYKPDRYRKLCDSCYKDFLEVLTRRTQNG